MDYFFFALFYAVWLIAALKYTRISVLILPLFFPLYLIRIIVFGIPVYFIEGLILITAVPVTIHLFTGKDENLLKMKLPAKILHILKGVLKPKSKPFIEFLRSPFFPVALFLIACTVSTFIVPPEASKQALGILKSWVIIPVVYFMTFYTSVKNTKDIKVTIYSYITSASLLALWALYQTLSGQYITIDSRASGPFESANYLAMYISPAFVFCTVQFLKGFIHAKFETADTRWNKFETRIYQSIVVALLFAVLILTQSYGGVAGSFAAIFLFIVYERFRIKEKQSTKFLNKFILFIVMIFIFGGTLAVMLNQEKFENLAKLNEHTSIATRVEIWRVGAGLLKENPLLGIGLGQYENQYVQNAERILGKKPFEGVRLHSHNLFMETWLNSGILGLAALIWLAILAFMQLKHNLIPEKKDLLITLLVMFLYILIHGLIDVPFWKNDLVLIFWMILAGIFAIKKQSV